MHPIERLRYVARAGGAPPSSLVSEAAAALAGLAGDSAALVTACRRLVERHPQVGPMWWLASRVLACPEPVAECWRVVDELDRDATARLLSAELGESAAVVLIGWPELAGSAVLRRGDLEVMVVDSDGEAEGLVRRLRSAGGDVVEVPPAGLAEAVASADVVLVEALALGSAPGEAARWDSPEDAPGAGATGVGVPAAPAASAVRGSAGVVAAAGSWAAAAVARSAGVEVILVAGAGRVLPARTWETLARRLDDDPIQPWDRGWEVIDAVEGDGLGIHSGGKELWDKVAGPGGLVSLDEALRRVDSPVVVELLTPLGSGGT